MVALKHINILLINLLIRLDSKQHIAHKLIAEAIKEKVRSSINSQM